MSFGSTCRFVNLSGVCAPAGQLQTKIPNSAIHLNLALHAVIHDLLEVRTDQGRSYVCRLTRVNACGEQHQQPSFARNSRKTESPAAPLGFPSAALRLDDQLPFH